tara:strand:+ start:178 stop:1074 length:897 start_codon:yes stop_codon:yes gene_type:complete
MENNNTEEQKNLIYDVNASDFIENIIEKSSETLIVADFWAPWCGPCKQLTPVLEKIVNSSKGKFLLAKINIDENQEIAAQLRIQSIPTVMAFKNKKIVNAFQGALPEKQIIEFIEKSLGSKLSEDNSDFFIDIESKINSNNFDDAAKLLEEFIAENSQNTKAIGMYLKCLIRLSKFEEAKDFISALSDELKKESEIKSAIASLEIVQSNSKESNLEDLEISFKKNPGNVELAIELSEKYFANNLIEKSFELLLSEYAKQNQKNNLIIKKALLKYFEALGIENEKAKLYRKKFSSLMFS